VLRRKEGSINKRGSDEAEHECQGTGWVSANVRGKEAAKDAADAGDAPIEKHQYDRSDTDEYTADRGSNGRERGSCHWQNLRCRAITFNATQRHAYPSRSVA
jgi:hypothetical protein